MTVNTCLTLVDTISPNHVDAAVKLRWLNELDAQIRVDVLGETPDSQPEPAGMTDGSRVLTVPYPFDRLYWLYLVSLIDWLSGDSTRYENGAALFNAAYNRYAKYMIRTGEGGSHERI